MNPTWNNILVYIPQTPCSLCPQMCCLYLSASVLFSRDSTAVLTIKHMVPLGSLPLYLQSQIVFKSGLQTT